LPNEQKIVAIQNSPSQTRLVSIDISSGVIESLLEIPKTTILNPRWSHDGNFIAMALKDSTGKQDIGVFKINKNELRYLYTPDEFHDNNPCWSPNGEKVFFTSDRSGIFNIWAVDVQSGLRWQVTDVPLGAFSPDVSPSGEELAFSTYTYSGFAVTSQRLNQQNWFTEDKILQIQLPTILAPIENERADLPILDHSEFNLKPYEPWRQILKPQGWIPLVFDTEGSYSPGIFALSEDALHRHFWQGTFGYSIETKRPIYDLFYQNSRFWPVFNVNIYNMPKKVTSKEHTGWWREQGFNTSIAFPLTLESNVSTTFFQPYVGFQYEDQKHSLGILFPRFQKYRGLKAGFQLIRSNQTFRDIIAHRYSSISMSYDWTNPDLKSEFKGHQITAKMNLIFPTLINHHQLQFFNSYQARRGNYGFGFAQSLPIGYDDDYRNQQFRFKAAYHFPLAYLEWPIPFLPLYFDYLSCSFFHDWGTSWNHGVGKDRWSSFGRYSSGIQLNLSAITFQHVQIYFSLAFFYRSVDRDWRIEPSISINY